MEQIKEIKELITILNRIEAQGLGMSHDNRLKWEEMVQRLKEIITKI